MDDQRERIDFLATHLRSLERLKAYGLIEDYGFGPDPADAWVRFDDDVLTLMEAGRSPMADPELWSLIEAGSGPDEVRSWLARAAGEVRSDGLKGRATGGSTIRPRAGRQKRKRRR